MTLCPAGEHLIRSVDDLRSSMEAQASSRPGGGPNGTGFDELRWEVEELRWTLNAVLERFDPLRGRGFPERLIKIYKRLRLQGVRQDLAFKLLESAKQALENREIIKPMTMERYIEGQMVSLMAPPPEDSGESSRQIIALVGPSGSGKTTTLAKLAADAALSKRKAVRLISLDTYRIGALEQLRIYAKIIGIPLTTAGSAQELSRAVDETEDANFVFIDTPSHSPREAGPLKELGQRLRRISGLETHLVLSATARDRDQWESIRRFGSIPIHALLFTRMDETGEFGTLFNQAVRSRKPLSYFSTGQKVPEDLEPAHPRQLARKILIPPVESGS